MLTENLLMQVRDICHQAGLAIMEVYNRPGDLSIQTKSDDSPLTEADLAAHQILYQAKRIKHSLYPV